MSSGYASKELKVVKELMNFVHNKTKSPQEIGSLSFVFNPKSVGPYGEEGAQWQAIVVFSGTQTTDYGSTVQEAAERLIDRLLYPEKYPNPDD